MRVPSCVIGVCDCEVSVCEGGEREVEMRVDCEGNVAIEGEIERHSKEDNEHGECEVLCT